MGFTSNSRGVYKMDYEEVDSVELFAYRHLVPSGDVWRRAANREIIRLADDLEAAHNLWSQEVAELKTELGARDTKIKQLENEARSADNTYSTMRKERDSARLVLETMRAQLHECRHAYDLEHALTQAQKVEIEQLEAGLASKTKYQGATSNRFDIQMAQSYLKRALEDK